VRPPAPAAAGCSSTFGARDEEAVMRRRLANYSGVAAGAGAVIEDDGRILRCFTVRILCHYLFSCHLYQVEQVFGYISVGCMSVA